MEKRFLLVEISVLPKVFLKVLQAKQMLADGTAKNVSQATKEVDISRSAFYKYQDSIFDVENVAQVHTVNALIKDETGALQTLISAFTNAGASIVTINQSTPSNGTASVAISMRTGGMQMNLKEFVALLLKQSYVVDVRLVG